MIKVLPAKKKKAHRFVLQDFMLFVICALTKNINATIKGRW